MTGRSFASDTLRKMKGGLVMAKNETVINNPIKLTPEQRKVLEGLDEAIKSGEHALEGLKKAGVDVTSLERDLNKAKQQREALLEYF